MIEIYVDGASRGNPGPSGAGIFIKYDGQVERHSIKLGTMSNHEAEFIAFIKALEICREKGFKSISVRTDSQIVEQSIEKRYVRNKAYTAFLDQALELMNQFELVFVKWIPGGQNKVADELARKAISAQ